MREVGWVVFDEIHYMRDKGNCFSMQHLKCSRRYYEKNCFNFKKHRVTHFFLFYAAIQNILLKYG